MNLERVVFGFVIILALTFNFAFVMGEFDKARKMLSELRPYMPGNAGLIASIGKVEAMAGNWAAATQLLDQAVDLEPLNSSDRDWLSFALVGTRQYEQLVEKGGDDLKQLALSRLGRTEEALLLGSSLVQKGNSPQWYFQTLTENGRFEELITFVESRWEDVAELMKAFPDGDGYGASILGDVAHSYSRLGNESKFNEIMKLYRDSLEAQAASGANNWALSESQAHYAMLSGDPDSVITLLGQSLQQGSSAFILLTGEFSVYTSMRGEPRFEEILSRMDQQVNQQRADLGLEPLST